MSTTIYVFIEKQERYQHFSDEKIALSVAMIPVSLQKGTVGEGGAILN